MERNFEFSAELPIGKMRQLCQCIYRKIVIEVRPDMGCDLRREVRRRKLKPQWFRVLLLAAGALHEDD
jgi:hypothetical protein